MRNANTQLTHAQRIEHARDQAIRVEKSKGKSDVQRNSYIKQRRAAYGVTGGKHAGKP
jgi:hypothetical protein